MPTARRLVAYALTAMALLGAAAGVAFAAAPSVIDPVDGGSVWSYADAADVAPKREGGYLEFNRGGSYSPDGTDYSMGGGFYDQSDFAGRGPHGGYDTSTNKCSACHAVHRAEGAYFLTRSDSPTDACAYCHLGAAPYSSLAVYTENPAGIYTPNGHTIGAGPSIPDSTTHMETEGIELVEGRPETTVTVRRYEPERKLLYRIVGYGFGAMGHPSLGGDDRFTRIGPEQLSCSSCHHTHGAEDQLWRPQAYDETYETDEAGFLSGGYKLLRRFPGATVAGDPAPGTPIDAADLAKVPESRLIADVNYSTRVSLEATYTENGETFRQPDWVAQGFSGGADGSATVVNQYTLSVWCADCHNLNIGSGYTQAEGGEPEAGRAHSDRTHTVPGVAAFGGGSGGSQCYSCHRNDLGRASGCSRCHYTPETYRLQIAGSDFPHSGSDDSRALLGAFSIEVSPDAVRWSDFSYVDAVITEENTDAVCLRCHAVRHPDYGETPPNHGVPAEYEGCASCHGHDAAEIHNVTTSGCDVCHAAATPTFHCGTCHAGQLEPHGHDANYSLMTNQVNGQSCNPCHENNDLATLHGTRCSSCHPTPRDSFTEWNLTCSQAGCHATVHATFSHLTANLHDHTYNEPDYGDDCWSCHDRVWAGWAPQYFNVCARCHIDDDEPPVTSSNAAAFYIGGATIQLAAADVNVPSYSLVHGVKRTYYAVDGGPVQAGTTVHVPPPLSGTESHTLQFWSLDRLGNLEPRNTVTFTIAADTTPPVTMSDAQPSYIGPATIVLTATDTHSTVAATYYRLDGGAQQTGTTVNVPAPPAGETETHTLEFWSVDSVGNVEPANTVTFTVSSPTATLRLLWTGFEGGHGENVYYELRSAWNQPIIASGYDGGPSWNGISTIYDVPVRVAPYYVYVYWNDIYDGGEIFGSVYVLTPGVVDWWY